MKDGIYDIPNERYHADRQYISSSGLKLFPDKVDEYLARYVYPAKEEPAKALILGSAIHCAILEPYKFWNQYVVEPKDINKRTNAGKAEYANFVEMTLAKQILTQKEMDLINNCSHSVLSHPTVNVALKGAQVEKSFFLEHDGIKQKVRPDILKGNVILDLKSTDNVYEFEKAINNYRYDFSAIMYKTIVSEVLKKEMEFLFIVAQKTEPYTTIVGRLTQPARERGELMYKWAKNKYRELAPGFTDIDIVSFGVPLWAPEIKTNTEDY